MLVGDIVRLHALNCPTKLALIGEDGTKFTWQVFNERVNRLSNALLGLGLEKGDRVAIVAGNSPEFAETYFAASKAGLVMAALNHRLMPSQLVALIRDAEPRVILIQQHLSELIDTIRSEFSGIEHFIGMGGRHGYALDYEALLAEGAPREPEIALGENDLHSLAYSSGTTGEPKGIPFTHRRWMSGLWQNTFVRMRMTHDDIFLSHFPMYMISGQFHMLTSFFAGGTTVIQDFNARTFAELIEREKVTITYLGGTQYMIVREYLDSCGLNYDLSSLRSVHVGSRPMGAEQLREMLDFFKIPYHATHKEYGATETVPFVVSILPGEDVARGLAPGASQKEHMKVESVGRPYLVEVRIVDDSGREVPAGETGEVVVRTEEMATGYWRKPQLSRERFHEGWFYTRDMGAFDEDGYLYLKGRKDFMIKSGQLFVSPAEVEDIIRRLPAVSDVAVIGVPDQKWGEMVTAVVCVKKGKHLEFAEIKQHCQKYLAGYQVPKAAYFADTLPKDAQGKTNIKELIRRYSRPEGRPPFVTSD